MVVGAKENKGRFTTGGLIPGFDYTGVPAVEQPKPQKPPAGSQAELQQALFYVKQLYIGDGYQNPPEAVKFVQVGINDWSKRFARLIGQPAPPDIAVTGTWDKATADSIVVIQKVLNLESAEHHAVGVQTWEALYPTRM